MVLDDRGPRRGRPRAGSSGGFRRVGTNPKPGQMWPPTTWGSAVRRTRFNCEEALRPFANAPTATLESSRNIWRQPGDSTAASWSARRPPFISFTLMCSVGFARATCRTDHCWADATSLTRRRSRRGLHKPSAQAKSSEASAATVTSLSQYARAAPAQARHRCRSYSGLQA
eukprot:9471402-Pyramimonas_sp.AAC.1